jgi:hypothetical protein
MKKYEKINVIYKNTYAVFKLGKCLSKGLLMSNFVCNSTRSLMFQTGIFRNKMLDWVLTSVGTLVFLVVAMFHVVFLYNWRWLFRRADCTKIDMIPGPKQVPFFGNIFLLKQPEGGKCSVCLLTCKFSC